jgi:hypothetical protein
MTLFLLGRVECKVAHRACVCERVRCVCVCGSRFGSECRQTFLALRIQDMLSRNLGRPVGALHSHAFGKRQGLAVDVKEERELVVL